RLRKMFLKQLREGQFMTRAQYRDPTRCRFRGVGHNLNEEVTRAARFMALAAHSECYNALGAERLRLSTSGPTKVIDFGHAAVKDTECGFCAVNLPRSPP